MFLDCWALARKERTNEVRNSLSKRSCNYVWNLLSKKGKYVQSLLLANFDIESALQLSTPEFVNTLFGRRRWQLVSEQPVSPSSSLVSGSAASGPSTEISRQISHRLRGEQKLE